MCNSPVWENLFDLKFESHSTIRSEIGLNKKAFIFLTIFEGQSNNSLSNSIQVELFLLRVTVSEN